MNRMIRFYNQNRKKFFVIGIIIVFLFILLQLFNNILKERDENAKSNINIIKNTNKIENENVLISDKSISNGKRLSDSKLNEDIDIIKKFIEFCNNKEFEEAYDLLTDECKEEMFSNLNDFVNIYYTSLFNGEEKNYTIENWSSNTYQVNFIGDILSTGKVDEVKNKQDYITIVNQSNNEYKININNYIGRTNINRQTERENIKINIESKDTYNDYEIYNIYVENNTNNTILLDTGDNPKSVYLLDDKDMKYYFYNNEIVQNKLIIKDGLKSKLKIKFYNSYSSTRSIEQLVFSKMILNYNEYKELEDKTQYDFYVFKAKV